MAHGSASKQPSILSSAYSLRFSDWRQIFSSSRRTLSTDSTATAPAAAAAAATATASIGRQAKDANSNTESDILLRNDDTEEGITTLTLNRPKQYNTLTLDLLNALLDELHSIAQDASNVRVVILKSSNPKCFSAGHDLKELLHSTPDQVQHLFAKCSSLMTFLSSSSSSAAQQQGLPQPIIAQVSGIATAAGCQLVASCDLALCDETAKFGVNGIDVGLFCATPSVALVHKANMLRKKALELLLTGNFLSAREALQYGLVNDVVTIQEEQDSTTNSGAAVDEDASNKDKDQLSSSSSPSSPLDIATLDLARTIASKSSFAVQLGKEAFYQQAQMTSCTPNGLEQAYDYCGEVMSINMQSRDAQEGIRAFLEKRRPTWKGC